jgi:hypothetical protein
MKQDLPIPVETPALAAYGIPRAGAGSAGVAPAAPAWVRAFSSVRPAMLPETRPPFPRAGLEPQLEADEEWTGEPAWLRERAEQFAASISARAWTDEIAVAGRGDKLQAGAMEEPRPADRLQTRNEQPLRSFCSALPGTAQGNSRAEETSDAPASGAASPEGTGSLDSEESIRVHPAPGAPRTSAGHKPAVLTRAAGPSIAVKVASHEARAGMPRDATAEPQARTRQTMLEVQEPAGSLDTAVVPSTMEANAPTVRTYAVPRIESMAAPVPGVATAGPAAQRRAAEPEWALPPRTPTEQAVPRRRVHIENLHVTVQRPQMANDAAGPAFQNRDLSETAARIPEPYAKRTFNPWLRRDLDYE